MRSTAEQRFWAKVSGRETDGCWLWTASCNPGGYGIFRDGKQLVAHRWSYKRLVGPIPEGLQLDHLCRVRSCVNPAHLEPVTQAENIRRGYIDRGYDLRYSGLPRWQGPARPGYMPQAERTHCPKSHPYDEANTYWAVRPGRRPARGCRACRRAAADACHARKANA